jgi:Predicted periplasmic protein
MSGDTVVTPPLGYIDFCGRFPAQCGSDAKHIAAAFNGAASASNTSESRKYFWMTVFDGRAPNAVGTRARSGDGTGTYDWRQVFGAAAGNGERSATAQTGREAATASLHPRVAGPATGTPKMTDQLWKLLDDVNQHVNRQIRPVHDREQYGFEDYWTLPIMTGVMAGDCKDYVLEKRRMLMDAGLPMGALSIALGTTAWGEYHAVLLVQTDMGDYVLDNLSPWILPWSDVSYTWSKRQSAANPDVWIRPAVAER